MTNPELEQAIRTLAHAEQREDVASKLYALAVDTFDEARHELSRARQALHELIAAEVEKCKAPRHAARTANPSAADIGSWVPPTDEATGSFGTSPSGG